MFVFPYRTKNPPEHPPYFTVGLIIVNFIVYFSTIGTDLSIRDSVVDCCAVSAKTINPITMTTSMFLHGSPEHILGNMLFLYIFGAALEGRLRPLKYVALYFIAGYVGNFTQILYEVAVHQPIPSYGASGAIMGLLGAYLLVFPHATIVVFRFFYFGIRYVRIGPADWKAWYVIVYYLAYDNLLPALIKVMTHGSAGGVGYFAHLGGATGGLLTALAMKTKKDSERVSVVQAMRTDVKGDLNLLTVSELATLLDEPTENMDLVLTYCRKLLTDGDSTRETKCAKMINKYKLRLLETGDPFKLAHVALLLPLDSAVPAVFYLKLGSKLEGVGGQDDAGLCYRRVFDSNKTSKDAEIALMRLGRMLEHHYKNSDQAREAYSVLLTLFPTGPGAEEAQKALKRLAPPQIAEAG